MLQEARQELLTLDTVIADANLLQVGRPREKSFEKKEGLSLINARDKRITNIGYRLDLTDQKVQTLKKSRHFMNTLA